MARICSITGKKTVSGHKVSHSQAKSKRTFKANLHKRRLVNPATGQKMTVCISAAAHRTLKKWQAAGKNYDLRKLTK